MKTDSKTIGRAAAALAAAVVALAVSATGASAHERHHPRFYRGHVRVVVPAPVPALPVVVRPAWVVRPSVIVAPRPVRIVRPVVVGPGPAYVAAPALPGPLVYDPVHVGVAGFVGFASPHLRVGIAF